MKWLVSKKFDICWFILPNFLSVLLAVLLYQLVPGSPLPFWFWVLFVMIIDVGHVYSTLFRIYFVPAERQRFSNVIWTIPIFVWICGALLYSFDSIYFWRFLAYVAVFHFVRQQYGFLAIYQNEKLLRWRRFEKYLIYLAMLHPLVYWHSHPERVFRWFITDDFIFTDLSLFSSLLGYALLLGLLILSMRFAFHVVVQKKFIMMSARYFLILGTALSWHVGIVLWNNDLVFTVTNVVSHGLPYYGLILAMTSKKISEYEPKTILGKVPVLKTLIIFCIILGTCSMLAYMEEGLWHSLHWRSYIDSFVGFQHLPQLHDKTLLSIVIPLLAVPQATHYVLDGFIWKLRGPNAFMQPTNDGIRNV